MEPPMPLHPGKILGLAVLAGALGLTPAGAADWDDYGYAREQPGGDYGHCRRSGWDRGGWDRRGWDDGGAVRGVAAQPGYGGCYVVERPIRDGWGNIVDYRRVEVCE
jgi:hypothetical protein